MEKLNRAAKCSILGPQNLGSGGGPGPRGPPLDPRLICLNFLHSQVVGILKHPLSTEPPRDIVTI